MGLPVEVVATTIGELGEASLLQTPSERWVVSMNRRRAARLIAAGAVGAAGVPVVLSLTAPSHQAAATDCGQWTASCSSKCLTLPSCGQSGYTVTCSYQYSDLSGGLRWEYTGYGYGC